MKRLREAVHALGLQKPARTAYRIWNRALRALWPLRLAVLRILSRSGGASTFYYACLSSAFRREHQAVLAGRVRYHDEQQSGESAIYLLRRSVHRIEKGLISRPRRSVFATHYIGAATDSYCQLASQRGEDGGEDGTSDELLWAGDVLSTYFDIAGPHPTIDKARERFLTAHRPRDQGRLAPYRRDLRDDPSVTFDSLHALARRRRSVRWFKQKPVPRELIDRALDVAVQAPSACNRQPYRFRIFDEPKRVRNVASIPMGTTGFSDNFPAVAVLVGEQSAYFDERDRHLIYIDASLAAMSFLFALESLGLSSCCINWPDIAEKEAAMQRALGLRPDERVIMLIAIGYPDPHGMVPYSQKRPLDSVRTYNK